MRAIFGLCGCVSGDGFYSVYDLCESQILSDGFSPSPVERGPDGVLDMDFHGTLAKRSTAASRTMDSSAV